MRVKITLSYDGSAFYGSQTQNDVASVFGVFDQALHSLNIPTKAVPSGRTDKGVHALSQICHVELPPFWSDVEKLQDRLNTLLPNSIQVKKIQHVDESFHARFDAKTRVYRYIFSQKKPSVFQNRFVAFSRELEFEKIKRNIRLFEGRHDFLYFQKTGSGTKTTTREIKKAFAYKHKEYIILYFEANGFLRSQVRLMTAALLKLESNQIVQMLNKEKKYRLKPVAPNGLYLTKIKY